MELVVGWTGDRTIFDVKAINKNNNNSSSRTILSTIDTVVYSFSCATGFRWENWGLCCVAAWRPVVGPATTRGALFFLQASAIIRHTASSSSGGQRWRNKTKKQTTYCTVMRAASTWRKSRLKALRDTPFGNARDRFQEPKVPSFRV